VRTLPGAELACHAGESGTQQCAGTVACPDSRLFNEGFFAFLLDGGQRDEDYQQSGYDQQAHGQRPCNEGGVVTPGQQQGTTEVFFHHGSEHQAQQQWSAFTFQFCPQIADCAESCCHPDVKHVVVQRVNTNGAEHQNGREQDAVGHL